MTKAYLFLFYAFKPEMIYTLLLNHDEIIEGIIIRAKTLGRLLKFLPLHSLHDCGNEGSTYQ